MTQRILQLAGRAAFLVCFLTITGCDSSTDGLEGATTFEGRVTDDAGFGKVTAEVDDAEVKGENVRSDGSKEELDGRTRTNSQGRFQLAVDGAADEVVLTATKAEIESSVMVLTDGRSSIKVMPMTFESHAEADVFVEARRQDDRDDVRMADVAAFVTATVASDVLSGATSAASVAAAIAARARAVKNFVREDEDEDTMSEARENEDEAFLKLQADLHAAGAASAQAAALEALERAMVDAYLDAGVNHELQARAHQAGRAALLRFSGNASSSVRFELQKRADIVTAIVVTQAIEAAFRAEGASDTRIDAVGQMSSTLISNLRAAASASALAEAQADFAEGIRAELASELGISAEVLSSADVMLNAARSSLDLAVTAASSAEAVSSAHATFFTAAETAARDALSGNGSVELAASVIALLMAS